MQYRRASIPGGVYFFTVVTAQRHPYFAGEEAVETLRQAFRRVRQERPFTINAIVILPDHIHCIWTLPPADADFATRWQLIKVRTTKAYPPGLVRHAQAYGRTIWQPRYWEHAIRDDADYEQHVAYIHYNPVKHKYVRQPWDWPYSSFRRYVKKGIYPQNWGRTPPVFGDGVGRE